MNRETIALYSSIVSFLGDALGPDHEVILHDVENKRVAAIANGHVSGRGVGAPLSEEALKMLADLPRTLPDHLSSRVVRSKQGRILRSSTYFIKNAQGELSGILCINLDVSKYHALSQQILQLAGVGVMPSFFPSTSDYTDRSDGFSDSVADLTNAALIDRFGGPEMIPDKLSQEERLAIVAALHQKGVFFLKGAVSEVAEQLQCSEASVYRYLSKLNRSRQRSADTRDDGCA